MKDMANKLNFRQAPRGSSWRDAENDYKYPPLRGKTETDVLIVGGGMAGVNLAYQLVRTGVDVVVLQDKNIGEGATQDTTAFLTQDVDTKLSNLISIFGKNPAKLVWESHRTAIDEIERITKAESLECDFIRCPSYIYARDEKEIGILKKEERAAKRIGFDVKMGSGEELAMKNAGFLELPAQAKFHPLKFLFGLARRVAMKGGRIFEKSLVTNISGRGPFRINTPRGEVRAQKVVIATYYPFKNPRTTLLKKGMYRSYVLEAQLASGLLPEAIYLDLANPYNYFRIDRMKDFDRMIIGGQDHRAELKINEAKNFRAVEEYLLEILPGTPYGITRKWSGPILEPSDGLALIGETNPNKFVATAFSGNGMTYSLISALLLCDLLTGKKNPWAALYDPKRVKLSALAYKAKDYTEEFLGGAVKNVFKKK